MPHQTIARQSILVALAALIPIPFVDTWLQDRLRAEMTRGIAHHHGVELRGETVARLSTVQGNLLLGCMLGVVWWPIKKLIRKVVYVLAMKDSLDSLANTIVWGWMLNEALSQGRDVGTGVRVREAMDTAMREQMRSPLWGPRSRSTGERPLPIEAGANRMVVWVARRGGADAALARFQALLNEPSVQA